MRTSGWDAPARPQRSTWRLFPSERAKQPGLVTIVDGAGQVIGTIDPLTRQRKNTAGRTVCTLTLQGWSLVTRELPYLVKRQVKPDYSPHIRQDRDRRR